MKIRQLVTELKKCTTRSGIGQLSSRSLRGLRLSEQALVAEPLATLYQVYFFTETELGGFRGKLDRTSTRGITDHEKKNPIINLAQAADGLPAPRGSARCLR
eukprot:g37511.t1